MKRVIAIAVLLGTLIGAMPIAANADQFVNGYTHRDGTYVAPHMRSSPDNNYNNNWSVAPNVNPYTGQQGTRAPTYNDRAPAYGQPLPNAAPAFPYQNYRSR